MGIDERDRYVECVGKEKKGGVVVGGGLHSGEQGKLVKDD
jgi:hypothetical protein